MSCPRRGFVEDSLVSRGLPIQGRVCRFTKQQGRSQALVDV